MSRANATSPTAFDAVARPGLDAPVRDGIVEAMGELSGRNRVAAAFYDGPGWARFRTWERWFLRVQGGESRARRQILRHLAAPAGGRVLEVGVGDGANLGRIDPSWEAFGVDISRVQLESCRDAHPPLQGRLILAEAEELPFADATFDACWTLGGFNYFGDHDRALREMARVTRPGGVLVAADEIPTLQRWGIGHLIGRPALDAWWLRRLGLDPDFAAMVLDCRLDPGRTVRAAWPDAARHRIWGGLGYCFVRINDPLPVAGDPR